MQVKKKYFYFIFLLCLIAYNTHSQEINTSNLIEYQKIQGLPEKLKNYIKLGDIYRIEKQNYDSAYYYYNLAINISQDSLSASYIADCINALGVNTMNINLYSKAISFFIKSLKICEKIKDKKGIAYCYSNIGIALAENHNYNKALSFFDKSIEIFEEIMDVEGVVGSFINYGQINLIQKNYEQAEKYFLLALKTLKKYNSEYSLALLYDNLGCTYMEQGAITSDINIKKTKFESAKNYLEKALYYHRAKNDLYGEAVTLYDISTIYNNQKQYDKAIKYADSSLVMAVQSDFLSIETRGYQNLSDIYKKLHNYEKALEYHTLFKLYNDSLFNLEKSKKINEIYIKYETEKKQNEINKQNAHIQLLEKEKEVVKFKMIGLWAFIIMTIITTLIIFISLKKRIKSNKQIYEHKMRYIESQKQLADTELKNQKLQSEQLKNELKYKNQEITNLALHLSERNTFLTTIRKELAKLSSEDAKSVIKYIEQSLKVLESERKEFEEYIENINKAFYIKLRQLNPAITRNEERLAALLKLNLSSKEIATIFNITAKSIDMSRYRLRKKLNISKDENLVDFLNEI